MMAKCSSSVSCFANADVLVPGKSMTSHGFVIQTATFTTLLEYELVLVEQENDYLAKPLAVTKVFCCSHPGMLVDCGTLYVRRQEKENLICGFFFQQSSNPWVSL